MNVFASLIERVQPPQSCFTANRKEPAPRDPRVKVPGNPAKTRKLYQLPAVDNPWNLTPHQALIVGHLAAGLSNVGISKALGLKVKTVEQHIRNAYDRMQAVETAEMNRVRAAVLWDRFRRAG